MKRKGSTVVQEEIQEQEGSDVEDDSGASLSDDVEESGEEGESWEEEEECGEEEGTQEEALEPTRDSSEPPTKVPRLSKAKLYKPPTNEELNQLKETENLFQSSLFRMQITELLGEVSVKDKKRQQMDHYLHKLKDVFVKMAEGKEYEVNNQKWCRKKKVRVPFIQKPPQVKGMFHFVPPKSVKVVGNYLLGTTVKPEVHVDMAMEIPKEFFVPKDFLNHRYLRKRALYLTHIATQLQSCDLVEELSFTYHRGNTAKPIIYIKPASTHGKNFGVRLHTYPEEGAFKLSRFHVTKNNIRPVWYQGLKQTPGEEADESEQSPTPHYNMAVLSDMAMVGHLADLHGALGDSQGLREGIMLLKVWLHQRQLDVGYGGFNGFIMSMFVLYLLTKRKLNRTMSSYQVLRNTLIHLDQAEWNTKGISLLANENTDEFQPTLDDFHSHFDTVFVDSTGYLNLCSDMPTSVFLRVKHEAAQSVQHLATPGVDSFQVLLMTPVPFLHKFDQTFHLSQLENLQTSATKLVEDTHVMDLCGNFIHASLPAIWRLLDKAVGRRVHLIGVKGMPTKKWSVWDDPPLCEWDGKITFGVLLNPEAAFSVLDKGPPADNTEEAAEFRAFWGEKADLRRFQDGSICEAVVWPGKNLAQKRLVCCRVIKYVLNRHADLPRESICYMGSQLDPLLCVPQELTRKSVLYGTGEEQHLDIIKAYDSLTKCLRSLKDLPLTLSSIQGVAPVFRYSEVFPALPANYKCAVKEQDSRQCPIATKKCPPWAPTMEVLCLLEVSGKWPEDRDAIQRMKAAFHITLGQLLEQTHSLLTQIYPTHVDVYKDGYVFRVHIGYKREIGLIKMITTPEGMVKLVDNEASTALERELVVLPKLTSVLHSVQNQHSSYCSAVRLAKRWVTAQLLADHIPSEAIELLMAYVFLHPAPYTVPNSPLVGFLRYLHLVGWHDWQLAPLVINFNNELKKEELAEIQTKFSEDRASKPLMFLATPYDQFDSVWTQRAPTAQILQRLVLLGRESLQLLEHQLSQQGAGTDFNQIFRPPLDVYDVVIHLKSKQLARPHHAIDIDADTMLPALKTGTQNGCEDTVMPVTNYDLALRYLTELREAFDDIALFFHDPHGGATVGVLWKPAAFKPESLKVSHINCRMPDTTKQEVRFVPNIEAILEDFNVIGSGLVEKIQRNTDKLKS